MSVCRLLSSLVAAGVFMSLSLPFILGLECETLPRYPAFTSASTEKFEHLAVNRHTNRVYVGAVDYIFQLNEDLQLEAEAVMGPHEDSEMCPVTRICPEVIKTPTHYHNKVLLIDYSETSLIACGSLFQGVCTVHHLDNVAIYETPTNEAVVANNASASTVAFISPGPRSLIQTYVLYVGVSYTDNGPYRSDVPAVTTRSLDPSNMFVRPLVFDVGGAEMRFNSMWRVLYPVTYVYGFSYRGFSYFVTVQKQFVDRPGPFITKLVRVCQDDTRYYSYTEVPVVCETPDVRDYNLAQAAYIARPGSGLALSMGISAQDSVLYVVFSKSQTEVGNEPDQDSVLCIYAMSTVVRTFTQNIRSCFQGHGERGLDFIIPSMHCINTQDEIVINDDFCGSDINVPIGGTIPVLGNAVLRFSGTLLTAVAATYVMDDTAVFLGTSKGHLKKVAIRGISEASEYSDITLEEGSPVKADMVFHHSKRYIYVMTEKKVTKIRVEECDVLQTCLECLGARDPYCGWCSSEKKCGLRASCLQAIQDPSNWISYKSAYCPRTTEVLQPRRQQTTANTRSNEASECGQKSETVAPEKSTNTDSDSQKSSINSETGNEISPPKQSVSGQTDSSQIESIRNIERTVQSIDSSLKELLELLKKRT